MRRIAWGAAGASALLVAVALARVPRQGLAPGGNDAVPVLGLSGACRRRRGGGRRGDRVPSSGEPDRMAGAERRHAAQPQRILQELRRPRARRRAWVAAGRAPGHVAVLGDRLPPLVCPRDRAAAFPRRPAARTAMAPGRGVPRRDLRLLHRDRDRFYATMVWSHPFVSLYRVYTPGPFAVVGYLPDVALVACALAVVIRFLGSVVDEERLQLTWFAAATAVLGVTLIPRILTNSQVSTIVMDAAVICLEATIAIAVLRYRLYDIDLVISRAVRYATLCRVHHLRLRASWWPGSARWRATGRACCSPAGRGGGCRRCLSAGAGLGGATRRPGGVRAPGHPAPGAFRLRQADRPCLLQRGRAARHGSRGRGRDRCAARGGVADGRRRAARRGLHRPGPAGGGAPLASPLPAGPLRPRGTRPGQAARPAGRGTSRYRS